MPKRPVRVYLFAIPSVVLALLVLAVSAQTPTQTARYGSHGTVLLPDSQVTPGAVRTTDSSEICAPGFSTKPYRKTTAAMKTQAYAEYGAVKKPGVCCEVDHLIPLELGGLDDIKDLWPQPYTPTPGAHEKDKLENWLKRQVCAGKMKLTDAQEAIRTDWYAAYLQMQAGSGRKKHKSSTAP